MCSMTFLKKGRAGHYVIPTYEQTANAKRCFSYPHKHILINKIEAYVKTRPAPTNLVDAKHAKALRRTVDLMKVHPPDTAWLIRWLGVLTPDDEIFSKSYKFKRPRIQVETSEEEDELNNDDGLWTDLPLLDDKTVRKTNRLRVSKKVQISKRIKQVRLTMEKA